MAPKQLEGLPRTSTENIKAWFSSEFNNAEKLQAHLGLLKAVGIFGGAIFVMRHFGDAFAA
jgi:hypothetical protein